MVDDESFPVVDVKASKAVIADNYADRWSRH